MLCDVNLIIFYIFCVTIVGQTFPVEDEKKSTLYLQKMEYSESDAGKRGNTSLDLDATSDLSKNQTDVMVKPLPCEWKNNTEHVNIRRKRFSTLNSKWMVTHLTYKISKYPLRLKDREKIDAEIAKAFKLWSDVTPLTFREKKRGRVSIDIRFEIGEHGDRHRFDGPGNDLAHASSPKDGGDVHFDDEESWQLVGKSGGPNLFEIAAHEFGHSLGLDHSPIREALMFKDDIVNNKPQHKLHPDDIAGIQSLYGSQFDKGAPPDEATRDIGEAADLCQDGSIDTVTRLPNGDTYVFKGEFYWKVEREQIADGYPRRISEDWGGLEGYLDASLTWPSGKTYFFKGRRFWRFTNKQRDFGYPILISEGFEGIPDDLDAAFVWSKNGKTYFFKGDKYWRYDSEKDPPVNASYPQPISKWNGLPNYIDAAFKWENEKTYFFKGDKYYRFNDRYFEVPSRYPRSTSIFWFNCNTINKKLKRIQL